jgi:HPt (histidine-containing phosphotransfer) domain-containing protein
MPKSATPTLSKGNCPLSNDCAPGDLPFDPGELLTRCMGSAALAQKLVTSFVTRVNDETAELERLLNTNQIEDFARKAHQLRGAAANISAHTLKRLFEGLERMGNDSRTADLPRCLSDVRRERDRFIAFCETLQWESAAVAPSKS